MRRDMDTLASVFAVATLGLFSATANAQVSQPRIAVDCHDVVVDAPSGNVRFTVLFNRAPDFKTVDAVGRQADSFQYFVQTVTEANFGRAQDVKFVRMIMRGEIPGEDSITIREVVPNYDSSSDPMSGGWGPVLGAVPFSLMDRKVEFIVPFQMLKTTEENTLSIDSFSTGLDTFLYFIETYEYGGVRFPDVSGTSRLPGKDGGSCFESPPSPDGSMLTFAQSQAGGTLVTSAGRWNFGTASNGYGSAVLLNGGETDGWATLLEVANGAQLYAQAGDGSWWQWNDRGWSVSTNPSGSQPNPDGSTLTPQSPAGHVLVTSAGRWNFGTANNAYGNAVLLNGGETDGWATLLRVVNGGQLYAQAGDGSWWRWNSPGWSFSAAPP